MDDQQTPATQGDVAEIRQDIATIRSDVQQFRDAVGEQFVEHTATMERIANQLRKDLAADFRTVVEHAKTEIIAANKDELAGLRQRVERLEQAVFPQS